MKKVLLLVTAFVCLSSAAVAHAQSGCINSPENPTAVLAIAGSAGAAFAALRGRYSRRK